jgi:vacuolar-type H+-ATPase subunit C/Vma6
MLLRRIDCSGYPIDYLVARVRARRGSLIAGRQHLLTAAAGGIWKSLLREYAWVYSQMDNAARDIFVPFFTCFELRTLFLCLRNRAVKNSAKVRELLSVSLLAENVKKILLGEQDAFATVAAVETVLVVQSAAFCGLRDAYREKGLQGLEKTLTETWLECAAEAALYPDMRDFVRSLIDFRNLLHLYKWLHWEIPGVPSFLKGGSVGRTRLEEVLEARQPAGIAALLRRFMRMEVEVGVSGNPEHLLLRGITGFLRMKSRETSGYGLILDYLWRLYIEAVNIGILCHGGSIDRETIAAELIP